MNTRIRKLGVLVAFVGLIATTAACTVVAPPDMIGLYYFQGSSEGNRFDHCVIPGSTDAEPVNDYVVWLPDNVRYWRYGTTDQDDVKDGIAVGSLPPKGGTSGSQVKVFSQTAMTLNTNCTDAASPAVRYWERVGRRFGAGWTGEGSEGASNLRGDDGWKEMMRAIVDVSLQAAIRQVARKYDATEMINNTGNIHAKMQAEIGRIFRDELARAAGGNDYFCGPAFVRGTDVTWKVTGDDGITAADQSGPCPPVEVTITNITRASATEQAATEEKAAAIERAAAALIGAQSLVDVRNRLGAALADPNYVRYLMEQERTKQVEICASKPGCIVRVGPGVDADQTG